MPVYQQLPSFLSSSTDIEDLKPRIREGRKKQVLRMHGRCERVELPVSSAETTLRKSQSQCFTCADDVKLHNYPYLHCFLDTANTILDQ